MSQKAQGKTCALAIVRTLGNNSLLVDTSNFPFNHVHLVLFCLPLYIRPNALKVTVCVVY